MMASRSERRSRPRRSSSLYLQFMNQRTGALVGDLADITRDGFRLESPAPIQPHLEFVFRVDVPAEISERRSIQLIARSLWSKPDPLDVRLYDTGFEMLYIDPRDARAIDLIIERFSSITATGGTDSRTRYSA